MALGIAVEASSVPAAPAIVLGAPYETVERSAWTSALDGAGSAAFALPAPEPADVPSPFIGPRPDGSLIAELPQLRGAPLLTGLGGLTRPELRAFIGQYPEVVTGLVTSPPAAADVAESWAGIDVPGRAALLAEAPAVLGALEGVPYTVRDAANRTFLDQSERDIRTRIAAGVGRAERDELTTRLHMLDQVRVALDADSWDAPRTLVSLDVTGEGRAVIAVGNLAAADYVSYLVPGMFFGVDAQIGAWSDTATAVYRDQRDWLARLAPTSDATVATIAWIGYHTPTLVNVASMELAREGRDALTDSLQGLRAARGDQQPYVSVLAHSYGSTAALLSLQEDDVAVDALAMVGSPGSPARSVDELHVAGGNVWVGAAEWDPIPQTGVFGSQPASEQYGAHHFGVNGGRDPITGEALAGATSHNDYFVDGGESLRNMALIGIGQGRFVLGNDGVQVARALARSYGR